MTDDYYKPNRKDYIMTKFTKEEVTTIINGVLDGKPDRDIAKDVNRHGVKVDGDRSAASIYNVTKLLLQDGGPIARRVLNGETPEQIAQKYCEQRFLNRSRAQKSGHAERSGGQLSRIEAKIDRLLAIWETPEQKKSMFRLK